jgi:trafficking protein particle complex subunit 12
MRLNNQAATECGNLWSILNAVEPVSSQEYLSEHIIPFELFVFRARTKYWASDFYGYLDDLAAIIRGCKRKARGKYSTEGAVWKDRASRVGLMMASQLLELQVECF